MRAQTRRAGAPTSYQKKPKAQGIGHLAANGKLPAAGQWLVAAAKSNADIADSAQIKEIGQASVDRSVSVDPRITPVLPNGPRMRIEDIEPDLRLTPFERYLTDPDHTRESDNVTELHVPVR